MAINPDFEIGMELFTKDGRRVELLAVTVDGVYVVSQVLRFEDYDGGYGYSRGETTFEEELWSKAPVAVVDEEIAVAEKKLAEAERLRSVRLSEALNAEREVKDRLAKLSKYKGLEHLEAFIDGKITHFVDLYSYDILTAAQAIERREYGPKLLSLFGDAKGNLEWRVNEYKDGSGSWREMLPATSEEDAASIRSERLSSDLADAYFEEFKKKGRPYHFQTKFKAATKHGIPVTDQMRSDYADLAKIDLKKAEEEALRSCNQANERLARIRSELGV
ncbi:hypothetical protein ATY75_11975 [Rhizobium sp. N122]|uniref:hypothetical protein n=1 Tax=Rhizobium sp. N122 TaxID=1764272 RepID=UPI000B5AAD00|nr:hypothetical protein [Rhizobium sp. N122]OWV62538.1 hypothetical protein ATY75_11975 [Rhizobium sp. N122]